MRSGTSTPSRATIAGSKPLFASSLPLVVAFMLAGRMIGLAADAAKQDQFRKRIDELERLDRGRVALLACPAV
jgi:hypothetical protein